jgi:hypothetical protein
VIATKQLHQISSQEEGMIMVMLAFGDSGIVRNLKKKLGEWLAGRSKEHGYSVDFDKEWSFAVCTRCNSQISLLLHPRRSTKRKRDETHQDDNHNVNDDSIIATFPEITSSVSTTHPDSTTFKPSTRPILSNAPLTHDADSFPGENTQQVTIPHDRSSDDSIDEIEITADILLTVKTWSGQPKNAATATRLTFYDIFSLKSALLRETRSVCGKKEAITMGSISITYQVGTQYRQLNTKLDFKLFAERAQEKVKGKARPVKCFVKLPKSTQECDDGSSSQSESDAGSKSRPSKKISNTRNKLNTRPPSLQDMTEEDKENATIANILKGRYKCPTGKCAPLSCWMGGSTPHLHLTAARLNYWAIQIVSKLYVNVLYIYDNTHGCC